MTGAKLFDSLKSQSDDAHRTCHLKHVSPFGLLTQNKTPPINKAHPYLEENAVVSLELTKLCDRPQASSQHDSLQLALIRRAGPAPMTPAHPLYNVTCDIISFAVADSGAKAEYGYVNGDHYMLSCRNACCAIILVSRRIPVCGLVQSAAEASKIRDGKK